MNQDTFERLIKSISAKCKDTDYPLCYSRFGQILTMSNNVLYIGTVQDAQNLSTELNRIHYIGAEYRIGGIPVMLHSRYKSASGIKGENNMTKDEMRACRREIINFTLQEIHFGRVITVALFPSTKLSFIKQFVREYESNHYNQELQAYK